MFSQKTPKITQVLLSDRIGGAETLARSLEREWARVGVESEIAYLDQESSARKSRVKRVLALRASMKRFKPTVVIAHSALPMMYARLASPFSLPIIDVIHSSGADYSAPVFGFLEKLTYRRSIRAVAVSSVAAAIYEKQVGRRSVDIIENGVSPLSEPKRDSGEPSKRRVVTLARVAMEKRPEFWADVAGRCGASGVTFEWYGPWEHDDAAAEFVREHKARGSFGAFMGPTSDPASVLASSDVLFHPSRREAQGVAIIEAAMSGVPVVCSSEVAAGLVSGLVAGVYDEEDGAEGAAQAILSLLNSSDRRDSNGLERARLAASSYGIGECAKKYLEIVAGLQGDQ